MKLFLLTALFALPMIPLLSFWPFPVVILAAFLIAWAAETAQFIVAQGIALAILAFLQMLPEFAVEAVFTWKAAKGETFVALDGSHQPYIQMVTANFTGAIRLLTGLALPGVFFVSTFIGKNRARLIELSPKHSVEVMGVLLPLLYFALIYFKGTLTLFDAAVLLLFYFAYLAVLRKLPPEEVEELEELPWISRRLITAGGWKKVSGTALLFLIGGVLIFVSADPFVDSLQDLALSMGVAYYFFAQWVAPFLTEFPEKVSIFNWARQNKKAPMAVMNVFSSNISQWTVLAAMIPVVYSVGRGGVMTFQFDAVQRSEILLTLAQGGLCFLFFAGRHFIALDAAGLFALWLIQFLKPDWRDAVTLAYGAWILLELAVILLRHKKLAVISDFTATMKTCVLNKNPKL